MTGDEMKKLKVNIENMTEEQVKEAYFAQSCKIIDDLDKKRIELRFLMAQNHQILNMINKEGDICE